ncbi:DNA internalization-related competence protein ComEC/Rec2 [Candidatus Marinamargulisbacteria bacterium SCGC AG-410-N11]|nr:DNA internalization-related competence protein ComEC/Rec2 [Candidatus Marinamargulisbacteria bacterium SCGC AG-410-N11]
MISTMNSSYLLLPTLFISSILGITTHHNLPLMLALLLTLILITSFYSKQIHTIFIFLICFHCFTFGFRCYYYDQVWTTSYLAYKSFNQDIITGDYIVKEDISKTTTRYIITPIDSKVDLFLSTQNKHLTPNDHIRVKGTYYLPERPRNPGQFDSFRYQKQRKICGTIRAESITLISQRSQNLIKRIATYLRKHVHLIHKSSLTDPYSSLFSSLIIGDTHVALPRIMKHAFQQTGLLHLLVVSGSQVSLLSGIIFNLLRFSKIPLWICFFIISFINIIFYFMTGAGSSIFRAILMNQISIGLLCLNHRTPPLYALLFSAYIMVWVDPFYFWDIGAQLSFAATASLLFGVPIIQSLIKFKPIFVRQLTGLALAPFLFTSPLTLYYFNNISPISIISNFLVVGWIEWLVVLGFFSTLIGFIWYPLAFFINQTCFLMMFILWKFVQLLAKLRFGTIFIEQCHWIWILIIYCLLGLFFYLVSIKRKQMAWSLLIICCSSTIIFLFLKSTFKSNLVVTFLDVGQGDSILITTPYKKRILIDAGNAYKTSRSIVDKGKSVVTPYLKTLGINKLDMLIISHFDQDHVGGVASVLDQFQTNIIIDNNSQPNTELNTLIVAQNINRMSGLNHQIIMLEPDTYLEFFPPFLNCKNYCHSENNHSVVFKLIYKQFSVLFTGDLEQIGEEALIERYPNSLDSTVLKLGHHGSLTSTTKSFLEVVSPKYAVISSGRYNRFNHPHPTIIQRLSDYGIPYHRTDLSGGVSVSSNGYSFSISKFLKKSL